MATRGLAVVTGAFGYSGSRIAARLLDLGFEVRTLTGSPDRPHSFGDRVETRPFDFDRPENNFVAALSRHAGWGYFDPGPGAGGSAAYGDYAVGFQNPPINWTLSTPRKRAFFEFLSEVTGERP